MTKLLPLAVLVGSGVLLGVMGCEDHFYGVSVYNETSNALASAHVSFVKFEFGPIPPGAVSRNGAVRGRIPAHAMVSWTSQTGNQFKREVDVATKLKDDSRFGGKIEIHLKEDGFAAVTVSE